jgi:CHAT domain-containing protein
VLAQPTSVSEDALRALVDDFRSEVMTYRGRSAQTWDRRASRLLEPLTEAIGTASTVVLLPDGPLNELPLHAVPLDGGKLLIAHARVVYAPSLHALSLMRARPGLNDDPLNSIVTVGVAFPDEARAIALRVNGRCLSGRRLDKEAVRHAVDRAKLLHFACHGYFDGQTALDCGLLLSTRTPPQLDDVLSVRDVAGWSLHSDLVTLSACETGRGNAVHSDFLSLARGFAGAGARSVIAALWPVDDRATQRLMLALYDDIRQQRDANGNVDAASALRAAQLEHSDASLLDWAAFKLIGWPEFHWAAAG